MLRLALLALSLALLPSVPVAQTINDNPPIAEDFVAAANLDTPYGDLPIDVLDFDSSRLFDFSCDATNVPRLPANREQAD